MAEDIARLGPMLILAGLMAGWLAEAFSRRGGYGFTRDLGLGLAGSAIGGATAWALLPGHPGMVAFILIGGIGAALLILAQRAFWRSARTAA
jgi:uncharacterized membrane protein YeaQ/YmgE (transglycosylase-associated protein family)